MHTAAGLLGRDAELAVLASLLADVRAGRGRTASLTGEAGIGKTRLAEALVDRASGPESTIRIEPRVRDGAHLGPL